MTKRQRRRIRVSVGISEKISNTPTSTASKTTSGGKIPGGNKKKLPTDIKVATPTTSADTTPVGTINA